MSTWGLYWVAVESAPIENCLVVAKNSRSAACFEESNGGFDRYDAVAERIIKIPKELIEIIKKNNNGILNWLSYIREDDLVCKYFDIKFNWVNGRETIFFKGKKFTIGSFEETYMNKEPKLVDSVANYLIMLEKYKNSDNIYRGQNNCVWELKPKIFRDDFIFKNKFNTLKEYEIWLLEQFKRKALPYIKRIPENDWEWISLAQHYGLATRLLDWSSNPLVALFFAIYQSSCENDAIVVIYNHGESPLKLSDYTTPFDTSDRLIYEPRFIDERIKSQHAIFTIEPQNLEDVKNSLNRSINSIFISADAIKKIRTELSILGYNEYTMFPSLNTVCSELNN